MHPRNLPFSHFMVNLQFNNLASAHAPPHLYILPGMLFFPTPPQLTSICLSGLRWHLLPSESSLTLWSWPLFNDLTLNPIVAIYSSPSASKLCFLRTETLSFCSLWVLSLRQKRWGTEIMMCLWDTRSPVYCLITYAYWINVLDKFTHTY